MKNRLYRLDPLFLSPNKFLGTAARIDIINKANVEKGEKYLVR